MKISIYHTNDVHSSLENFAKAISIIKKEKQSDDLLFDAGDFHDFKRIEMQGTKGRIGKKLLEYANYDAMAIGNNEMFLSVDVLEEIADYGKVPCLSMNIKGIERDIQYVKETIIIKRKGIRFLILGTSPDLNDFSASTKMKTIGDCQKDIEKIINNNRGNYDISILISHMGFDKDKEFAKNNLPIDIIIGGHSHTVIESPMKINQTIIVQAGDYGNYLGKLELTIEDQKISDFCGELIATKQEKQDQTALELIKEAKKQSVEVLSQELFKIDQELWNDPILENPITNLICDRLLEKYPCDLAMINSGICNSGLGKSISKLGLLQCSPSPLNPTLYRIKGKYIKEALMETIDGTFCIQTEKWPGYRGLFLGRLHVSSNVEIFHDIDSMKVSINGGILEDEMIYTIISSDFLFRGSGYQSLGNGELIEYKEEYIRDCILEGVQKQELLKLCIINRYKKI